MDFQIDIDGTIGAYGYSKQYVRQVLEENRNREVNVRINSLGGSLDDALDMAARFNNHGNVTAYLFGYCASAATVASLGAKKVVIDENAFYLVHKVSNWVDVWGSLNADQMAEVIADLEKNKKDNEKMDLVLAHMYAKKSGKSVDDIMQVLKDAAWLTASETKEWGFVDEIGKGLTYKTNIAAKLNAYGLPLPTPQREPQNKIVSAFNKIFNNQKVMLKNLLHLNSLLKVEGFDEKEDNVQMTVEQMTAIDNQLKENSAEIERLNAAIAERDNTIKELTEKVDALENQPGDDTKQVEPQVENVSAADLFNLVKNLI